MSSWTFQASEKQEIELGNGVNKDNTHTMTGCRTRQAQEAAAREASCGDNMEAGNPQDENVLLWAE